MRRGRNRASYSDAVHSVPFSLRGVLDISCPRCSRFRARHSYFIFDLTPTIAVCDFCRFIFWRASCRGFRTSDLAFPGYRCALFRRPAPRNKPADLIRATLKSGIVTAYSVGGALVSMAIMEFSSAGPFIGLISASIFAAAGWWLGLLMTKHPLLAQIGMAAMEWLLLRHGCLFLAMGGAVQGEKASLARVQCGRINGETSRY